MALEAKKRRRRSSGVSRRRRRVSTYSRPMARRRSRRRSYLREDSELGAAKSYAGLAMQFLEAGAGGVAGRLVSNMLPIQNTWVKAAAGAGLSVMVATQLKRPIFATGMAASFAGDLLKGLNIGGLNEAMAQGEFIAPGELSQPQMIYLGPSGEPVFLQEDGSMLYADGSDSGMDQSDYDTF